MKEYGRVPGMYSQFGEDAWLVDWFKENPPRNKWCFEVGAADGRFYSNTLWFREHGWSAALVEANEAEASKLIAEFGRQSDCRQAFVDDIDVWLDLTSCPTDLDFGSIDVDGPDYHLFRGMVRYRPRVLCVEFSPYPNATQNPEQDADRQAAKEPMLELAELKGYELAHETFCNLLLVDKWNNR